MKKVLIFSALLSLFGCANSPLDYKTGTEVTQEQLSQFVAGKTSQAQVVGAIGQPNKKEVLGKKEVWYYDYNKISALFGGNISESTVFEWSASGQLIQSYKTGKSGKTGNVLIDTANGNK